MMRTALAATALVMSLSAPAVVAKPRFRRRFLYFYMTPRLKHQLLISQMTACVSETISHQTARRGLVKEHQATLSADS